MVTFRVVRADWDGVARRRHIFGVTLAIILQQKGRVVSGPCLSAWAEVCVEKILIAFSRPGSDLLSRVLRRSTIGAGAFHGRVRNGNGCGRPAITTRSAKGNVIEKLEAFACLI